MPKKQVRIIAWDDCAFSFSTKRVKIVGAVFRGGEFMDGLLSASIKKDGSDATEKISRVILKSRHFDQLSYVMTNGITFGGLNLIDISELSKKTGMPVIAVIRKMPDLEKFGAALDKFNDAEERKKAVINAGEIFKYKDIYYQKIGLTEEQCKEIFKITCIRSKIPEPLRVAHLIASGLGGESRGRA